MTNYFELFELPTHLPVDLVKLTERYQQLQRQYHPDNFMSQTKNAEHEKSAIMKKSASINEGYRVLKNPIKVVEYLLSLHGIDLDAEQNVIHDTDFLMEQFELREELDEIDKDSDKLDQFDHEIRTRKAEVYQILLQDLEQKAWQNARQQLYKIRYLDRLIEQIETRQEEV